MCLLKVLTCLIIVHLMCFCMYLSGDQPIIRLADGNSKSEGRVEVFYNGTWGTICDDNFDQSEAEVVCKELGFLRAVRAYGSARFGMGQGRVGSAYQMHVACTYSMYIPFIHIYSLYIYCI